MLAIAPEGEFDVERGPDWLLVRVKNLNPMDTVSSSLAERLWRLLQQHFTYRMILEMDEVRLLNSPLIGQLIQLHRWIKEQGGVLRLCGLSAANRQALRACRLDDRLLPYKDRQEALMGFYPNQPR
jgi:anti-anti-sigma regulatory factor